MKTEVTFLVKRGAAVMRKSHIDTSEQIRFGRGTGNEVPLPDLRVALSEAALSRRGERLVIERLGDAPLRVNGESIDAAPVGPGDEILIGPYKIVLTPPPEGFDAALSVELVQPMGDALGRLMADSRIGLERTHLSKRRLSWALFVLLALIGLALPIASYSVGIAVKKGKPVPSGVAALFLMAAWNPGEISNPHRFFAPHCATCHQGAFALVQDSRCLICHGSIGNHMASTPGRNLGPVHRRLDATRCATCHQEHRGLNSLVIREGALCFDCHGSLAAVAPNAGIHDVSGFPGGHPQFRVTLVRDAATLSFARAELGIDPKPVDHPNLVFSHAAHLVPEGFPALGYKPMSCADCHAAEPGGEGFLPITYQRQCRRCHALKFERRFALERGAARRRQGRGLGGRGLLCRDRAQGPYPRAHRPGSPASTARRRGAECVGPRAARLGRRGDR